MDLEKIQKQLETLREIGEVEAANDIEEVICEDVKDMEVFLVIRRLAYLSCKHRNSRLTARLNNEKYLDELYINTLDNVDNDFAVYLNIMEICYEEVLNSHNIWVIKEDSLLGQKHKSLMNNVKIYFLDVSETSKVLNKKLNEMLDEFCNNCDDLVNLEKSYNELIIILKGYYKENLITAKNGVKNNLMMYVDDSYFATLIDFLWESLAIDKYTEKDIRLIKIYERLTDINIKRREVLSFPVGKVLFYEYKKLELLELHVGKESYDLVLAYMRIVDICRRSGNYYGIVINHRRVLAVLRAIYEKEENIKVLEYYIKKLDEGQEAIKRNDDSLIIIYMSLGHQLTNNYYNKLEDQQEGVCYLENALDLTVQKYGEYALETLFVCYDLVLACSWMIHLKDEKMHEKVNKYYEKFKYILEHNQNQGVMLLPKDAEKNMFKVLDWRISIMKK